MTELRRLGRTDIKVPPIALGTMTWGEQNSEAEGHAQLDYALDRGINFIDTAESYSIPPRAETQGSTERIIGSWLKARGNRDKVILATKVAGRNNNSYLRPEGTPQLDRKNIHYAIDQSLKRLQTDYVDLYQLHSPDRSLPLFAASGTTFKPKSNSDTHEIPIEETLDALADLVKQGKVRHVGVSNETAWGTGRFVHAADSNAALPRVASIQNAYNLLNRTFEIGLAEIAHREDVGLLAYSPLAQGFLTGKYRDGARPEKARLTLFDRGQRYQKPGVAEAVEAYLALAAEHGLDPAQFAIAFVASRPFVTSAIIGATTLEQLKTDIDSLDLTITPELEDAIDAIHQLHSNPAP
ncbi:NADP(H)-dependent aldo-keto reductase [Sphingobium sufflavum]|uniref:NADP(H)-dependent aldo-keto reductase n=1 Tax=Sphingobium sufflavum TaxID=1129547 RepID=UPI001F24082B|nr:NADP(H)-dependent aldo-keto reductase [Sphingobium sufflavum]MCE7796460.1 NADP(H)-dependent aldo-keto reductase [Sphingobium sufflavum]